MFAKKNWLFTILTIILVFTFTFTLAGCPLQRERAEQPRPVPQNKTVVADKISAVATRVEGVQDAYTVVTANTALVGITLKNQNTSRNEMVKVEDQVAKTVIQKVSAIGSVYVTAAPEIVPRIRDISQRIARGEPITRFTRDIQNITRDLRRTAR